jgi:hypothetical protein
MATTGRATAASEFDIATKTDTIAAQQDRLTLDTQNAANNQATGDFISSAIKGAAAVATLFVAPEAKVVGYAATSAIGDATGIGGLY